MYLIYKNAQNNRGNVDVSNIEIISQNKFELLALHDKTNPLCVNN
jgi:hypothetical protein